ncbi:hypothetical protein SNEBB_008843 [Seison nebaliae]|nr:hypothetical protein SNEBB_008843 [Seison nebaliae]
MNNKLKKINEIFSKWKDTNFEEEIDRLYEEFYENCIEIDLAQQKKKIDELELIKKELKKLNLSLGKEEEITEYFVEKKNISMKLIYNEIEQLKLKENELEKEIEKKMKTILPQIQRENELCQLLDEKKYYSSTDLNLLQKMRIVEERVNSLEGEYKNRYNLKIELRRRIEDNCKRLEIPPSTLLELDESNSEISLKCSQKFLVQLSKEDMNLTRIVETNEKDVNKFYTKIQQIWNLIDRIGHNQINDETFDHIIYERKSIENYFSQNNVSDRFVKNLQNEMEICLIYRKKKLKVFWEILMIDLSSLWRKCHIDESITRRAILEHQFDIENVDEELLNVAEDEIIFLKKLYEDLEKFFESLNVWDSKWNEYQEFLRISIDPKRFRMKNYSLFEEGKNRTQFMKNLRKYSKDIRNGVEEWEKYLESPFFFHGMNCNDYFRKCSIEGHIELIPITSTINSKNNEKENKLSSKNQMIMSVNDPNTGIQPTSNKIRRTNDRNSLTLNSDFISLNSFTDELRKKKNLNENFESSHICFDE